MSRRGLRDEEIERLLCEIPSDEDSTVDTTDDESDYEASIVAEAIVSSEGEVSESEEESESTPPKRAADTAPTWGQQFNATSGMQFDSESGPSAFIRDIDDPEPIDIFEKIFPKELVELIVFQTNLYATQSGKSFTPTTDNEIRTFLGINILMGIKRMPAYRDYWSSAPELHDRYIASLMAVNRFGWLLRNIHLNDNTLHPEKGHPGYDKLYKLRPVIKILSESFSKCYQPSKHLAIDESMIKFKGRNSMKQYMRDKPIKRGYKVWMLCDKTSYNLKFDIYTGKRDRAPRASPGHPPVMGRCRRRPNGLVTWHKGAAGSLPRQEVGCTWQAGSPGFSRWLGTGHAALYLRCSALPATARRHI
ncbi:piggyBac transposable element-derived protein 4-like [Schistocerca serialis cubense]|uniref:piggyBac transposable element-derived protein 4-like n=1 Tax=Schistocerca serialis cubense TaxID=2023355 RepID=UPI00214F4F4A|nr:piggyBac transposable element-derived protein 4-like [Schistocerca serialis cubense]